jgi:predicted dehydrogenase
VNAPLSIALIGCGRAAERYYAPALARFSDARLVAVADPLQERCELIASSVAGCATFTSAEMLLHKARIEGVIVATPPATHGAIAALALRAGLPVLVEKPLAPSLAEAKQLEHLVAASTGSIMVGFSRRYWSPVRELRDTVAARNPSEALARCIIASNIDAWAPISGMIDVLDDLGPHQFDTLRYVFDREISAISARWIDAQAIDMRVKLGQGVVAECQAAYGLRSHESIHLRFPGGDYRMHADSERIAPAAGQIRCLLDFSDAIQRRLLGRKTSIHRSFEQQLASFCHYARTTGSPEPGIAAGLAVTRAIEAARTSAANGGVEVPL